MTASSSPPSRWRWISAAPCGYGRVRYAATTSTVAPASRSARGSTSLASWAQRTSTCRRAAPGRGLHGRDQGGGQPLGPLLLRHDLCDVPTGLERLSRRGAHDGEARACERVATEPLGLEHAPRLVDPVGAGEDDPVDVGAPPDRPAQRPLVVGGADDDARDDDRLGAFLAQHASGAVGLPFCPGDEHPLAREARSACVGPHDAAHCCGAQVETPAPTMVDPAGALAICTTVPSLGR